MLGMRFGVNMMEPGTRAEFVDKVRRAEDLGFDVVTVADHLGMPAPFPALALAAETTSRVRLGTFVLNAPFYHPAVLARDVATTDQFCDGRLELGLGAGYVREEFEAAGLPWPGRRIDHVERTVVELRRLFADPDYQPRPAQDGGPPLLLGGWGDRMLTMAAEHADTIALTGAPTAKEGGLVGLADADAFAERVAFVRSRLGTREAEINVLVQLVVVTDDRRAALADLQRFAPDMSVEAIGELPTLLVGSVPEIVAQLSDMREKLGITYVSVLERSMADFAQVLEHLS
ncbi:TIGR03621 family F420-dependent LLM class oxidoreductase [Amycolatopsis thermalba]|uniref:TIGR03621 family F420-dependent LLM class oxidoreductase n=1 Tax=Amycolatopsis thermalba TaxID=944492 RepID=A0ABY4NMD7_9PSEU|nr:MULTISPECIES: TIGR03621 family F420-dependent LLM class oxidoreductase [Amycolatopsis]UQS21644.1 TIGR03621 family F420-dependent LLM class oxidoreductase [Amycolatopsis thermalba]